MLLYYIISVTVVRINNNNKTTTKIFKIKNLPPRVVPISDFPHCKKRSLVTYIIDNNNYQ